MGTQGDRSRLDAWAEMRYHVYYNMYMGGLYLGRNEKKAVFSFCSSLGIYNGWVTWRKELNKERVVCYDWFPHSPDGTPKWQTWAQHISWPPSHRVYLRL